MKYDILPSYHRRYLGRIYWMFVSCSERIYYLFECNSEDIIYEYVVNCNDEELELIKEIVNIIVLNIKSLSRLIEMAISENKTEIAQYILHTYPLPPDSPYYRNILHKAVFHGNMTITSSLLFLISKDKVNEESEILLQTIVKKNNVEILPLLLNSGKVYPASPWERNGHLCIYYGKDIESPEIVRILLEFCPMMNTRTIAKKSIERKRVAMIRVLRKYSTYFRDRDWTLEAADSGSVEIMKEVMEMSQGPGCISNAEKVLTTAFSKGNKEMLRYLLTCERITENVPRGLLKNVRKYLN